MGLFDSQKGLTPGLDGRRLTAAEYHAYAPEKLELIEGEIPDAEKFLLLALTSLGLRRALQIVGADLWKSASE